ncbi:MAG: hypothetical protein ACREC8_08620, partial [Limisphaerales bacterium]
MELNDENFKKFKKCYKDGPPKQDEVGQKPSCLFQELGESSTNKLFDQQLDREMLRELCFERPINSICALICVMAWGGMRLANIERLKKTLKNKNERR